jgi:hypothetical protein
MRSLALLRGAPLPLVGGFALFLVAIGYVIASSLAKPHVRTFAPTPTGARAHASGPVDTLTVDGRDDARWAFVDLHNGQVLAPPDTTHWDIAVRRHRLIASGALADLGKVDFDHVTSAGAATFVRNKYGSDTSNTATGHWYAYNMLTHVLEPNGHVWAVRARDASMPTVKLQILGYYCPGVEAGCLTIRFARLP